MTRSEGRWDGHELVVAGPRTAFVDEQLARLGLSLVVEPTDREGRHPMRVISTRDGLRDFVCGGTGPDYARLGESGGQVVHAYPMWVRDGSWWVHLVR